MPEISVEANEKYRQVVEGYYTMEGAAWNPDEDYDEGVSHAAEEYAFTIESSPEIELDPTEYEDTTLSWGNFSVSKDPDLVSKMSTYFDGMAPDEPTDLLRAKLRLLDCEVYANTQIAAQAELRDV